MKNLEELEGKRNWFDGKEKGKSRDKKKKTRKGIVITFVMYQHNRQSM